MLLSARTESNQRCAKGTPSMNTSPQAGVHRRRPPGPPFTRDALQEDRHLRPAAPNTRPCVLLASGARGPSSSQSPLYSGRPSVGIRHVASLRLLSPPNPLRWALAGPPIKYLRCTDTAYSGIAVAAGQWMGTSVLCAKFPIPLSRYSSLPRCKAKAYRPPDHRRTQQVGKREAVWDRSSGLQILMAAGPGGPRVGECTVKI